MSTTLPRNVTFITGNIKKLEEAIKIIGQDRTFPFIITSQNIDLPEYQGEIDEICRKKCQEALKLVNGPVLVEDTSLCFNALNGLPGPYIKWFLKGIGPEGLYNLLNAYEDKSATAITTIGYAEEDGDVHLFHGETSGTIVSPRGSREFGWDCCFQPNDTNLTYGEMTKEQKNEISHRKKSVIKYKEYMLKKYT